MPTNFNFCRAKGYLFAALAVCAIGTAQEPVREVRISAKPYVPAPAPLRVETDLVEVGVVVRSHDGRAIPGLTRENFVVKDEGSARDLTYFAVETPGVRGGNPQKPEHGGATSPSPASTTGEPAAAVVVAPPRFVALYFENFGTSGGDLKHAQVAGRRFIQEGLDDTDRVAVFSSSGDFLDYTNDKGKLIAAIDKLKTHPRFSEVGTGCPRISAYQAYQIAALFDYSAIDAAKAEAVKCNSSDPTAQYHPDPNKGTDVELIRSQAEQSWGQVRIASQATLDAIGGAMRSLQNAPGRRLLLLVSAGFNTGTLEFERDRLINLALRAGIVINALDAKGLYAEAYARGMNDPISNTGSIPFQTFRFEAGSLDSRLFLANQAMSDLAQATGGLFFHNNNDLPYGFRQLGSIPEVSYVLGFHRGDAAATDGKYHKLKVALVDTKPYVLQARPGYFALPPAAPLKAVPLSARERFDREVTDNSTLADVAATLAFRLESAQQPGMTTVKAQIHVAIDKLQFPIRDKRHVQQLRLVAALLDANGNIVAAKEGIMDFALSDATYTKLTASGINAGLNLDAPPGRYRLRAVVQEAVEGKMATTSVAVEVK